VRGEEKDIAHRGKDLMSARDATQDEIMNEAFWCVYCMYAGVGCMSPSSKGCCMCIGELCCFAGTCKSATCCDGDGCLAATIKCFCSVFHAECPPSLTPGIGCGPLTCLGNLTDEVRQSKLDAGNMAEVEEFDLLNTTCWCCFAYMCGYGCNSPGGSDPCCKVEGKVCCVWANLETDTCCDDGWIEYTGKSSCIVCDASCPAGYTPGCGACNQFCCCEKKRYEEPSA